MFSRRKHVFRPIVDPIAAGFLALGFSPTGITLLSLALALGLTGAIVWTQNLIVYLPVLLVCFGLDAVDGAAARLSGRSSRLGSYLDAICDRISEIALYFALGAVSGAWMLVFALATTSLLFSYAKARAAMEVPVDNQNWPDVMERPERMVLVSLVAFVWAVWPELRIFGATALIAGGWIVVALIGASLLQRLWRAYRSIDAAAAPTVEPGADTECRDARVRTSAAKPQASP